MVNCYLVTVFDSKTRPFLSVQAKRLRAAAAGALAGDRPRPALRVHFDGPGGSERARADAGYTVPQSPRHPQNLNGAGFSLWPGLLVGNRLLQPCLVLHREVFPGDAFFSTRGSDDMSLTHQMDGCCYTHDTPFFMGLWRLWGYAGNQSVVANRWIPAGVDHVS